MDRPDLSNAEPTIRAYIEFLESQLQNKAEKRKKDTESDLRIEDFGAALPSEPPTRFQIITSSRLGYSKRTYRHFYSRQHRSGMGVFDLEVPDPDYPQCLVCADESQNLLVFTSKARVYRQPISRIQVSDIRSRGENMFDRIPLEPDEFLVTALVEQASGYVAMITSDGRVRCLRHHLFGEHMRPGTSFFNLKDTGPMVNACWTPGDADLLIVTQQGMGIRFSEKLVNPQGDRGIRLGNGDQVCSIASVDAESHVFFLGSDGRGTIRQMTGFAPNKSLGGSGKIAMKNDKVISALTLSSLDDEIFAISKLGKIIRFKADEVPVTEGTVQGVVCMSLRSDEVITALRVNTAQQ